MGKYVRDENCIKRLEQRCEKRNNSHSKMKKNAWKDWGKWQRCEKTPTQIWKRRMEMHEKTEKMSKVQTKNPLSPKKWKSIEMYEKTATNDKWMRKASSPTQNEIRKYKQNRNKWQSIKKKIKKSLSTMEKKRRNEIHPETEKHGSQTWKKVTGIQKEKKKKFIPARKISVPDAKLQNPNSWDTNG